MFSEEFIFLCSALGGLLASWYFREKINIIHEEHKYSNRSNAPSFMLGVFLVGVFLSGGFVLYFALYDGTDGVVWILGFSTLLCLSLVCAVECATRHFRWDDSNLYYSNWRHRNRKRSWSEVSGLSFDKRLNILKIHFATGECVAVQRTWLGSDLLIENVSSRANVPIPSALQMF